MFPVSRSTWWAGIRAGRFPKGVKLGPRITDRALTDSLLQHPPKIGISFFHYYCCGRDAGLVRDIASGAVAENHPEVLLICAFFQHAVQGRQSSGVLIIRIGAKFQKLFCSFEATPLDSERSGVAPSTSGSITAPFSASRRIMGASSLYAAANIQEFGSDPSLRRNLASVIFLPKATAYHSGVALKFSSVKAASLILRPASGVILKAECCSERQSADRSR